ncbi:hypothetical protein SLEP1_g31283 [Rubroshorea leprosula]|uniref:Uncharacterized protein n=1 Tax=Rubroshorea leprosula TaxID=152421 RepID=A0AAV5K8X4_9ROSI|nr:hypothetical protein SLEP1_g31283 [Rubroshorea leprosula]
MSCVQMTLCMKSNNPMISKMDVRRVSWLPSFPSNPFVLPICANHLSRISVKLSSSASPFQRFAPRLGHKKNNCISKFHQRSPVCLLGGEDNSASENEGSPWKAIEKAMGSFKKPQSVEDTLRKQMQEQEYYGGGEGSIPPRDRGGSSGGGNDAGGPEDEGPTDIMDETLQVILATMGIILLYVYIINGEELLLLIKDYVTYQFRGTKSTRLIQAMDKWGRFYENLTEKKVYDQHWLEQAIINTRTWFDYPEKYGRVFSSSLTSNSEESS